MGRKLGFGLETWKTIRLGIHKSVSEIRCAFEAGNYKIGSWAEDILDGITFCDRDIEVELVAVTAAELGFKCRAYYADIVQNCRERGLFLCPAEVGVQLRLQYSDQPEGEWIVVAMQPIVAPNGRSRRFLVRHDEGCLLLSGFFGGSEGFWSCDYRWVFVRRH